MNHSLFTSMSDVILEQVTESDKIKLKIPYACLIMKLTDKVLKKQHDIEYSNMYVDKVRYSHLTDALVQENHYLYFF